VFPQNTQDRKLSIGRSRQFSRHATDYTKTFVDVKGRVRFPQVGDR